MRGLAYRRAMVQKAKAKARRSRMLNWQHPDKEMMVNKLADNLAQCSCFLCKSEKKLNIPTKQELIATDITKFSKGELNNV